MLFVKGESFMKKILRKRNFLYIIHAGIAARLAVRAE